VLFKIDEIGVVSLADVRILQVFPELIRGGRANIHAPESCRHDQVFRRIIVSISPPVHVVISNTVDNAVDTHVVTSKLFSW
jgi:hypothetical protein